MSDLDIALRFIRDNPCAVVRTFPDIGAEDPPEYVVFAAARGSLLGWLVPGDDESLKRHLFPVRSVYAVGDKSVHVHLDQDFPHITLVFRKLAPVDLAARAETLDGVDDLLDSEADDLEGALREWKKPPARAKKSYNYVVWREFRRGQGLRPAGVIGRENGVLTAIPFLDFEEAADVWNERFDKGAPSLEDLQEHAGRATLLSGVEEIEGYDYHDALNRAAHLVAGRVYQEEGKVILQ